MVKKVVEFKGFDVWVFLDDEFQDKIFKFKEEQFKLCFQQVCGLMEDMVCFGKICCDVVCICIELVLCKVQ